MNKPFSLVLILLICSLNSCKKNPTSIKRVEGKRISISDSITPNHDILNFIEPYKAKLDDEMNKKLAYNPTFLSKTDGAYNTALGNLLADLVLEQTAPIFEKRTNGVGQIDMVLLNHGGIRSVMNAGDITTRTAYQVMPFENEIVVVELSGFQMKEMIDFLVKKQRAHPFTGLKIVLDENKNLKEVTLNGEVIDDNKTYFVATSDYLQNGGDSMTFFTEPVSKISMDYKIRNMMIDYFVKTDTIQTTRDSRFTIEQ